MTSSRSIVALLSVALAACEWTMTDLRQDEWRAPADSGSMPAVCGRAGESCSTSSAPASCGVEVDRWKELLVIHRSVLLDSRARNDVDDAPWSFRSRMEELASDRSKGNALAHAWLAQWTNVTSVGPDQAPVTPRPRIDSVLVDPWTANGGKLTTAPFRLIAIVNRPDLREQEQGCGGQAGELRFVYTAVDPSTARALPMTVIVEIPYPATRSARGWIEAWHALASKPFGAEYTEGLAVLTSEVTKNAKAETWLVRTNEDAFAPSGSVSWEMREFALETNTDQERRLVQMPIATTPRIELDHSPSLDSWALENRASILDGSYVVPGSLQAGAVPIPNPFFRWSSRTLESSLVGALNKGTCNGCHGGEKTGDPLAFQHLAAPDQSSPYYSTSTDGETQVSRWLNGASGSDDELSRRETSIKRALCGSCAPPPAPEDNPGSGSAYER